MAVPAFGNRFMLSPVHTPAQGAWQPPGTPMCKVWNRVYLVLLSINLRDRETLCRTGWLLCEPMQQLLLTCCGCKSTSMRLREALRGVQARPKVVYC